MGQQRFVGMGINTLRPLTVLIAPDLSACNHTSWAPRDNRSMLFLLGFILLRLTDPGRSG